MIRSGGSDDGASGFVFGLRVGGGPLEMDRGLPRLCYVER